MTKAKNGKNLKVEACKWNRDKADLYEKKVLDVINIQNREELPFDLPPEIKWPSGEREKSERAMIILRMGYAGFLQKYGARREPQQHRSGADVNSASSTKDLEIDDSWA